jgi:hypothetical protein
MNAVYLGSVTELHLFPLYGSTQVLHLSEESVNLHVSLTSWHSPGGGGGMGLGCTVGQSGNDPGTWYINFQYVASVVQTQELPSHGYSHVLQSK